MPLLTRTRLLSRVDSNGSHGQVVPEVSLRALECDLLKLIDDLVVKEFLVNGISQQCFLTILVPFLGPGHAKHFNRVVDRGSSGLSGEITLAHAWCGLRKSSVLIRGQEDVFSTLFA